MGFAFFLTSITISALVFYAFKSKARPKLRVIFGTAFFLISIGLQFFADFGAMSERFLDFLLEILYSNWLNSAFKFVNWPTGAGDIAKFAENLSLPEPLNNLTIPAIFQFLYLLFYLYISSSVRALTEWITARSSKKVGDNISAFGDKWIYHLRKPVLHWLLGTAAFSMSAAYVAMPYILYNEWLLRWPFSNLSIDIPNEGILLYNILWGGFILFLVDLFAAGRKASKKVTDKETAKEKKRRADRIDTIYEKLKDTFPAPVILISGERTSDRQRNMVDSNKLSTSGWTNDLCRELKSQGRVVGENFYAELGKIEGQLGQPKPTPVLIEESLTEPKMEVIAAIIRHFRDRGKSILVIVAPERMNRVSESLKKAESRLTTAVTSEWFRLNETGRPKAADCILYGTVDEIDEKMFRRHENDTQAEAAIQPTLNRLGAVFILEAQAIDIAQTRMKLELLRYSLTPAAFDALQFVVQAEPMEFFREGISNALFNTDVHAGVVEVNLSPSREYNTKILIWNYDDSLESAPYQPVGQNKLKISGPLDVISSFGCSTYFIDEEGREAQSFWNKINNDVKPEALRSVNSKTRKAVILESIPTEAGNNDYPPIYMERDWGNLASVLVRDLASERTDTLLFNILAEPSPFRGQLINKITANAKGVESFTGQKVMLATHLPRVPDIVGGFREMLRALSYALLASPSLSLTNEEIVNLIRPYSEAGVMNSAKAVTNGNVAPLKIVVNAKSLSDLFEKWTGVKVELTEKQNDDYQHRIQAKRGELMQVINGNLVEISNFAGSSVGLKLQKSDEGQYFSLDSLQVLNRENYKFNRIENGYRLSVVDNANSDTAGGRTVFERSYNINDIELISQLKTTWFSAAIIHAYVKRETIARYFLTGVNPFTTLTGNWVNGIEHSWIAQVSVLRFKLPSDVDKNAISSTAITLCLTLQDVLRQKFPSVGHRLAVVSPNCQNTSAKNPDGATPLPNLPQLCKLAIKPDALSLIRKQLPFENSPDSTAIELMIIEDAEHDLGVAWHLNTSVDSDPKGVLKTWHEFLEYCANAKEDPYNTSTDNKAILNYKAAFSTISNPGRKS